MWTAEHMHNVALYAKEEKCKKEMERLKQSVNIQASTYAMHGSFSMRLNIEEIIESSEATEEFLKWLHSYGYITKLPLGSSILHISW